MFIVYYDNQRIRNRFLAVLYIDKCVEIIITYTFIAVWSEPLTYVTEQTQRTDTQFALAVRPIETDFGFPKRRQERKKIRN